MNLIDELNSAAIDAEKLENYVKDNFVTIYDLFSTKSYKDLLDYKLKFRTLIRDRHVVLRQLNLSNKSNLSFLILLFQYAEMFGLLAEFRILHNILSTDPTIYGNRLQAAALYCLDIRNADDFIDIYDAFLEKLSIAYLEEEDNEYSVIATFINYYAQIVYNFGEFNQPFVTEIRNKIIDSISRGKHYFLTKNIFEKILDVDTIVFAQAYSKIKSILDDFLKRKPKKLVYEKDRYLFEQGTEYKKILLQVVVDFNSIRGISVDKYCSLSNKEVVRTSLQRGVKILESEEELFAYMYNYGLMHYAKLNSAFEFLPSTIFEEKINIIDWGCGQGLATMAYLDFLQKNKYTSNLINITFIEPSIISLKRATLHTKKMDDESTITTIHKDLDSLVKKDFLYSDNEITLHLFSNILDVDSFSMNRLLNLLNETMKGTNYFLCVSPNISVQKNARIDSFFYAFSKSETFKLIKSIDDRQGEWKHGWSRVIRVFKVVT